MNATVESTELESLLDHEARCEATHAADQNPVCSVEVVARFSSHCTEGVILICQRSVEFAEMVFAIPGTCQCGIRAERCWAVVPA